MCRSKKEGGRRCALAHHNIEGKTPNQLAIDNAEHISTRRSQKTTVRLTDAEQARIGGLKAKELRPLILGTPHTNPDETDAQVITRTRQEVDALRTQLIERRREERGYADGRFGSDEQMHHGEIPLTEGERETLHINALRYGLTTTEYARRQVTGRDVRELDVSEASATSENRSLWMTSNPKEKEAWLDTLKHANLARLAVIDQERRVEQLTAVEESVKQEAEYPARLREAAEKVALLRGEHAQAIHAEELTRAQLTEVSVLSVRQKYLDGVNTPQELPAATNTPLVLPVEPVSKPVEKPTKVDTTPETLTTTEPVKPQKKPEKAKATPVEVSAAHKKADTKTQRQVAARQKELKNIQRDAKSENPTMRQSAASNSHATAKILAGLATDPEFRVRMEVAKNFNTSPATLEQLRTDPHPSVQYLIAKRTPRNRRK